MDRRNKADVKETNLKVIQDIYRRFATNKLVCEQVDITDVVTLQVKANR